MERGCTARRRARGGDLVPAFADVRARLKHAAPPLALLAGLAAYPVAGTGKASGFALLVGATAVFLLALALLWRLGDLVLVALVVAGAQFVLLVYDGDPGVAGTVGFATGLVLVAEVSFAAVEPAVSGVGTAPRVWRAIALAATVVGSGALTLLVLAVTDVSPSNSLALDALGVGAAVVTLGLVARLFSLQRS